MVNRVRCLLCILFLLACGQALASDARFDLVGPKIDVRVTRAGQALDIAQVPNLQPGDKIWLHPDLPTTQSVHYLLICVFLRGTTNPPPDAWFIRIETWDRHIREEGTFVTVPAEATQAVLLLAPETGGDFSTLKSTIKGRPGVFVRADQDLIEAGFEQARIEKYLASIRRVPASDAGDLQKHSNLLARTLALKPDEDCFKRPVDTQFTCLTQTGNQTLLDDGHGQSVVSALSNGSGSDFINAASYTPLAGAGLYSAYVGAIVDLVRIMGNLHTAKYQYIPAIAFPQGAAMNLRLNTPPSFLNPKSVLVIGLPAVQKAIAPPLRPADANQVSCLLKPAVTLPIEGAPLVFSTSFAHDLVLHLNTPAGAPAEEDIPLVADAYQGGLVLQHGEPHRKVLREELKAKPVAVKIEHPGAPAVAKGEDAVKAAEPVKPQPRPALLTGTISGFWGFDPFTGPTVQLQQLPGQEWHVVRGGAGSNGLIAGQTAQLLLASTATACVHTISARPAGAKHEIELKFVPQAAGDAGPPANLEVTLPVEKDQAPGDLHLAIQQYSQPKADELSARTFAEPAKVKSVDLHAGDKTVLVNGSGLGTIASVKLGDLVYMPQGVVSESSLRLGLAEDAAAPATKAGDHLTAEIALKDGRTISEAVVVTAARPSISLLSKTAEPASSPALTLGSADDLPLSSRLTFTVKSVQAFPRDGQIDVETLDGTLHATLTLAPAGGLLLQDPHTIVATLDPSRSFGPSAFGALHVRAEFPAAAAKGEEKAESEGTFSDWVPLVTLVRLPVFSSLQCPADEAQPCMLSGANFFLLQAVSVDPAFASPQDVPDGFTGTTLTVPHPLGADTLFFKLRDDPGPIDSASVAEPVPAAATAAEGGRARTGRRGAKATTATAKTTAATAKAAAADQAK